MKRSKMGLNYAMVSIWFPIIAHEVVEHIRGNANSGSGYAVTLGLEIALVCLGFVVLAAAYGMVKFLRPLRRWMILIIIGLGVVSSFMLDLRGGDPKLSIAVYFVPQMLLFFS